MFQLEDAAMHVVSTTVRRQRGSIDDEVGLVDDIAEDGVGSRNGGDADVEVAEIEEMAEFHKDLELIVHDEVQVKTIDLLEQPHAVVLAEDTLERDSAVLVVFERVVGAGHGGERGE